MKLNNKRFSRNIILFFVITGWLRVMMLVIPSVWIYMNTQDWRSNDNQESSINKLNDNIPTLKIEQGD
jgi:hypothetical protein